MSSWTIKTGDDVPKNLTKDWYSRKNADKIVKNKGIRGTMPGEHNKAERINNKLGF